MSGRPDVRTHHVDLHWPSDRAAGNPRLRAFEAYWRAACRDGQIPPREALDPVTLPTDFLGWLILSERTGERVYRYRLFGSNLVRLIGRDLTDMADRHAVDGRGDGTVSGHAGSGRGGAGAGLSRAGRSSGKESPTGTFSRSRCPTAARTDHLIVCTFVDMEL